MCIIIYSKIHICNKIENLQRKKNEKESKTNKTNRKEYEKEINNR